MVIKALFAILNVTDILQKEKTYCLFNSFHSLFQSFEIPKKYKIEAPYSVYVRPKTLRLAHYLLHCNVQTNRDMVAYGFLAPFWTLTFYMNALVGLQFLDIFGLKNKKKQTLVSSHQEAMTRYTKFCSWYQILVLFDENIQAQ